MSALSERTTVRELDGRTSDGIEVRLLWNSETDHLSVAVEDGRSGEAFELEVDSAEALAAFHHPYAYVNRATPTTHSLRERDHTGGRS
jgi:hypothetical protein